MVKGIMLKSVSTFFLLVFNLYSYGQSQALKSQIVNDSYHPSCFDALHGWSHAEAIRLKKSLLQNCKRFQWRKGAIDRQSLFGTYEKWHSVCLGLANVPDVDLQAFFRNNFKVYEISPHDRGLFTGYYTPAYKGSRVQTPYYNVPVLKTPADLISINLSQFSGEETGRLYGKLKGARMVPYDDRAAINQRFDRGEYANDVLAWLHDPVDRLFLQIQGSGYIQMTSGEKVYMRFDSKNGQPYYPVGRYLKEKGWLDKVSMQTIRQWLQKHPDRVTEVLNTNRSFIFFNQSKENPTGAFGIPLTAERSVAVDPHYIPLGFPLWIETTLTAGQLPYHHAFTAQDTGSAIKGALRADIYFGSGLPGSGGSECRASK